MIHSIVEEFWQECEAIQASARSEQEHALQQIKQNARAEELFPGSSQTTNCRDEEKPDTLKSSMISSIPTELLPAKSIENQLVCRKFKKNRNCTPSQEKRS